MVDIDQAGESVPADELVDQTLLSIQLIELRYYLVTGDRIGDRYLERVTLELVAPVPGLEFEIIERDGLFPAALVRTEHHLWPFAQALPGRRAIEDVAFYAGGESRLLTSAFW